MLRVYRDRIGDIDGYMAGVAAQVVGWSHRVIPGNHILVDRNTYIFYY